ncbi:MAG: hypothetical protein IKS23_05305 [Alphaproteobacteria bacterium]|nr:hypothetical protein [Alphaproteobacteria bacterium]
MQHKSISKIFYGAFAAWLLSVSPAHAIGFPTLDIAEVLNTIQSVISQAQAQIATVQETLSIANIQQAIGDKVGGLKAFQTAKKWAEEQKEKVEKQAKRLQRLNELKKKYEQEAKQAISDVKEKYDQAKGVVDSAVQTVNDTKEKIEGIGNQVENFAQNVQNKVNDVKSEIDNVKQNVTNGLENIENTVNNLTGSGSGSSSQGASSTYDPDEAADLWGDGSESASQAVVRENVPASLQEDLAKRPLGKEMPVDEDINTTEPKAFKSSYVSFMPMAFAEFTTGTNDYGDYYFSDTLSQWCGINYTDMVDEEVAINCFKTICAGLNEKEATKAKEYRDRYGQVIGETISHNFSAAVKVKDKAASSKVTDAVNEALKVSGGDLRTQVSGNGEVSSAETSMAKDGVLIQAGSLEVLTITTGLEQYCHYLKEAEKEGN